MNLDKKALAGFIKEVEDSRARQKAETELQSDVFKRARKKHFDVKALRIVLQRRAMDTTKRDEQDYNVHAYEHALGVKKAAVEAMEQGASAREAAERFDLPRAAVTALKGAGSKNAIVEPSHDPDTGEIAETAADTGRTVEQAPARNDADGGSTVETSCGVVEGHEPSRQTPSASMAEGSGVGFESPEGHATAGVESCPHDTDPWPEMPAHLDRRNEVPTGLRPSGETVAGRSAS